MIFPTIFFLSASLVVSVLALYRFLQRPPSILFVLIVVTAIYIPISITFLLPIDILSSNDAEETQHNFFYLSPKFVLLLWKFDYWSSFVLMWTVLPIIQEYYRSGEFTTVDKIKDSLKSNLKFYLVVGAVGVAGLVYYFLKFGFHFQTFKSLLIALSHTYSLILSLWLMSHGLINIPKRRWLGNINLDHQLENLYAELPKVYEELNETTFNFKDICATIRALENVPGVQDSLFKLEVDTLLLQLPTDLEYRNHIRTTDYTNISQLSHSALASLHSTLKKETTNYRSALFEYNKAKSNILRSQDIVDSKPSKALSFKHGSNYIRDGRLNFIIHVYVIPALNLAFATFLFALSFVIIESEMFHSTKLSIVNALLASAKISSTGKFLISFILITYMAASALITLTRIKILKMYHLFPRDSNPVSVVFFTMYANRLTVPLAYNFLTLLQSGKVSSQFNDFLGKSINLSILGGFFNENLPRVIIVPVILTIFNVFDRIKKKFSLDYFDAFEEEENGDEEEGNYNRREQLVKEGKLIIQRATNTSTSRLYQRNESSDTRLNLSLGTDAETPAPASSSNPFNKISGWLSSTKDVPLNSQDENIL